ncbi:zinc dependent phospholipase C family protein [Paenibacillus sp. MSJ-34]|uniref:zinc dependent phospholipase C family protein n=1 Tax=Paenibacillus sp. MSJ-34 TaxID=2841529 RepID=UPI001C10D0EC|nr:zinc dependent phospholipase C family protein [Paenibacillus sp. MSJ-34]MBU5440884.1 zinc dependent phospholipase C family protein [Paenibacillus sp. MSJ-34]
MPNIWTHLIFGQEVLQAEGYLPYGDEPELKRVFNMGCQGPDFLFYHHFWPWKKDKTMNLLGSAMHSLHCGGVLLDMIEAVSERAEDDPARIYILGFALHHVLDRNMHPYVFYRSGFKKWSHQRFEIWMDTLIVKRKLGLETWRTPVWKEIDTGGRFPDGIVDLFQTVAERYYPDIAARIKRDAWDDANRDMIRAQRLFHDPSGFKRIATFGRISPLVYKRRNKPLDILNESRTEWRDPTGADASYTTSVWDQWTAAREDAAEIVRAVAAYWAAARAEGAASSAAAQAKERVARAVGNRSYETGMPCDSGHRIQVAEPII